MRKMKYLFSNRDLRKLIVPLMLEQALAVTVGMADTMMISSAGEAANGVANSLDSVGIIAGQAMNLAMITVIGQCVGADDKEQIRYYLKKLLIITYTKTYMDYQI